MSAFSPAVDRDVHTISNHPVPAPFERVDVDSTVGRMGDAIDDLGSLWRWYGHQFRRDSAIYGRIADAVAEDRDVLEILAQAPPAAHLPPAPLAAVHYLLLEGLDDPLVDVYAGRSDADPGPLFLELCRTHRVPLLALLETRRVQTNDCGRSAIIGPALTWAAAEVPGPYGMIDVGASAGINLHCDRYLLDYGHHGTTGPADSTVRITCDVTGGDPPIADRLPALEFRAGIDMSPIDLSDPADAQWLLACVWPDTGRSERVRASIQLAQRNPVPMVEGRANDVLPRVLMDLPAGMTAMVTTTWAFAYFSLAERAEFVDLLRDESTRRHVVWLSAESSGTVDGLAEFGGADAASPDVLGAVRFDDGVESVHLLGYVQSHGNWIDWRAAAKT